MQVEVGKIIETRCDECLYETKGVRAVISRRPVTDGTHEKDTEHEWCPKCRDHWRGYWKYKREGKTT